MAEFGSADEAEQWLRTFATASRVCDLQPGDEVTNAGMSAVFVAATQHPIWPSLRLVVWRMPDGRGWSHDALNAQQEIGVVTPSTLEERMARVRKALLEGDDR